MNAGQLVHIIFATRHYTPYVSAKVRERLYPYLMELARDLECAILAIGGGTDHIHLLVRMHPGVTVAQLMGVLKANSFTFLREHFPMSGFYWESGYTHENIADEQREAIVTIIADQKAFHRKQTARQEVAAMRDRLGLPPETP